MPGRVFFPLMLCLFTLAVSSAARAEIMEFTPSKDNTLYEDLSGSLSNGSGDQVFFGRTGPNADSVVRRALLHFDVSAIPGDAVIDSVELSVEFDMIPPAPNGGTAFLHRLLADWGEGDSDAFPPEGAGAAAEPMDATWVHRSYDTELWDVSGGDFQLEPSASVGYGIELETITFTTTSALIRDLNKWVGQPNENFGWILIGNEGLDHTARRFDSRENNDVDASPALLTVEYHIEGPTDDLVLEQVASGLNQPVGIVNAGDESQRLFIVEQAGVIRIYDLQTDTLLPTPFLDISDDVESGGFEQGLLGLAFHPDYETNRRFYVNYTYDPSEVLDRTRIAMYQASIDPDIADTTETVILEFEQDAANHNGGDMHFDRDGYLVISSGDGGGGGDQYGNAQNVHTLKGAMLRIDVDGDPPIGEELCGITELANYAIPAGNAFPAGDDGCDEILHYGLRNPWRFSFDARTEEMYIGDVGQSSWEEVDLATAGAAGLNFGWPCFEGTSEFDAGATCPEPVDPIIEYPRSSGNCAVTGGYVYRGGIESLQGRYVYADYCSARIWIATRDGDNWVSEEWMEALSLGSISTFGQDETCELYVADFNSDSSTSIYRIVDTEEIDHSGFEQLRCQ